MTINKMTAKWQKQVDFLLHGPAHQIKKGVELAERLDAFRKAVKAGRFIERRESLYHLCREVDLNDPEWAITSIWLKITAHVSYLKWTMHVDADNIEIKFCPFCGFELPTKEWP